MKPHFWAAQMVTTVAGMVTTVENLDVEWKGGGLVNFVAF